MAVILVRRPHDHVERPGRARRRAGGDASTSNRVRNAATTSSGASIAVRVSSSARATSPARPLGHVRHDGAPAGDLLQHPHREHAHGHGGRRPPGRRIGRRSAVDDRPVAGRPATTGSSTPRQSRASEPDARQVGVHREPVGRNEVAGTQHAEQRREDQHRALGAPRAHRPRARSDRAPRRARPCRPAPRAPTAARAAACCARPGCEPRGDVEQRERVPLSRDAHEPVEHARPRPVQLGERERLEVERRALRRRGLALARRQQDQHASGHTGRARWRCGTRRSAGRP